jgi:type IV pilus assembly protein PilB
LVEATLISEDQLKAALIEQKKWGGRLGRTLVEMGFVTESSMVAVLASQLQLRSVDLDAAKLNKRVTDHLRLDLAERYGVFPLGVDGNTLYLATSDPTNLEQMQELEFATNKKVQVAVATASSIDRSIRKYYFGEAHDAMQTIHPRNMGVAVYELDEKPPPPPPDAVVVKPPVAPQPPPMPARVAPPPVLSPPPEPIEQTLRKEIAVLREQVDALETISASQVRALRGLLEILIESGLVTRDEYVERLHVARDDDR